MSSCTSDLLREAIAEAEQLVAAAPRTPKPTCSKAVIPGRLHRGLHAPGLRLM